MELRDLKMPIKVTPYQHQEEAWRFVMGKFENPGGAALLIEMGCGKSLISVAAAGALYQAEKIRKLLIVCPLSICGVWEEEFSKFAGFDYDLKILRGTADSKTMMLNLMNGASLQVAVVNYESVWRIEPQIKNWMPDMIIVDESHKIKTHNIAASKSLHRLGEKTSYRLILTGTLITNKAIDAFSQYKFLEPRIFGKSFYAFRNRYFDMVGYGNHTPVLKKSMEPELKKKIHSIAFRATKAECLDLPETTDIVRSVELEPNAMNIYKHLVRDSFAELSRGEVTATNILTKILRLSQLTGGFLGDDEGKEIHQISTAKLNALEDIVDEVTSSGKKLVVIARFIPEIEAITDLLSKKKLKFSIITGNVKNRSEQIEKFQNDSDVLVFVGQIATAGLGITLTAASTMVFYSLDYSMSNFEQTKARIHRAGQCDPCTYIYLIAKGTIDEKVMKSLNKKYDLASSLIDDYRQGLNPFKIERK
ncbi:MAG: DEAD/DEAH box helicase [Acutalibacteraceae bacterium]